MHTATHDPARYPPALTRALEYVHAHLSERICLRALADLVGLSPGRLSNLFRHHLGVPPHRYIGRQRIAWASELLLHGMPAAAVADACGFYDQSHFSRHFKQHLGVTPGQYAIHHAGSPRAPAQAHRASAPPPGRPGATS